MNDKKCFIAITKHAHLGAGSDIETIVALFCEDIREAYDIFKKAPGIKRNLLPYELKYANQIETKIVENIILKGHSRDYYEYFKKRGYYEIDIIKWNKEKFCFTRE